MEWNTIDSQNLTESARTVADLKSEVQLLRQTVKALQNELHFVLSFLGITNTSRSQLTPSNKINRHRMPVLHQTRLMVQ